MQEEQRQDRALLQTSERTGAVARRDLERSQEPIFHAVLAGDASTDGHERAETLLAVC